MPLGSRLFNKPGAMVFSGLVFWVLAWVLDMWTHVETYGVNAGAHEHGGSAMLRINIPLTGAPLIVFGLAMLIGSERLMRRGGVPLLVAAFTLMTDGLLHAFAFNDHLGSLASAAFFAFVAPAQVAAGVALVFLPRDFDRLLVGGTAFIFALYLVSRTAPLAALGWPEPVEALDVASKVLEVLFLMSMASVARARVPRAAPGGAPGAAAPPGGG
jgi:hypothetical protein